MAGVVAKTYTQKPAKFQIHPINENQIFDPYGLERIVYAPARTGFEIHCQKWNQIFGPYG